MDGGIFGWISRQDTQSLIIGCGVIAAALTAIAVALRPVFRSRPVRWLGRGFGTIGRVLIADPLTKVMHQALDEWAAKVWEPRISGLEVKVDEVRDQFRNNGGSTMRDRVDAVAEATGAPSAPRVGPAPDDSE